MAEIEPLTTELLQWAKRHARAEQRNYLVLDDLVVGAYALVVDGKIDATVFPGGNASRKTRWPESIPDHYRKAGQITPVDASFKYDDGVGVLVKSVHSETISFDHRVLLQHLLKANSQLLTDLRQANAIIEKNSPLAALGVLVGRANALRERLAFEVLGQDQAISMLSDAYFRACLAPPVSGPRGIFTFMGPPGVGKTLLAQELAKALSAIEGRTIPLLRLDMSTYSAHQNHEALIGFPKGYANARAGVLTGFVKEHPECVILLDEIEKAHENTIHALLAVLDKGAVKDQFHDEVVQFNSCWIVATTNLGNAILSQPNRAGVLGASATASEFAFDVLKNASSGTRGSALDETLQPLLSPEFVSRLAQGSAVVFGELDASELLRLVERSMTTRIANARLGETAPGVKVEINPDARFLFLQSLLPDLDARKASSRAGKWVIDLIKDSWEACASQLNGHESDTYRIVIDLDEETRAALNTRQSENGLKVLVIDEDPAVTQMASAVDGIGPIAVRQVRTHADATNALKTFNPDVAMLDLSLDVSCGTAPDTALKLLSELRTTHPALPIHLFADRDCAGMDLNRLIEQILSRGGARGLIPIRRDVVDSVTIQDTSARVKEALTQALNDRIIRDLMRSRLATRFEIDWHVCKDTGEVLGKIRRLRRTQVISVADQGSAISFAGIPRETFNDVIGLSRAKRRLSQVLQWMKDPAALARFGVLPPRGFLLAGVPGTGKTLLARALAGEAGLPFLALSAGELQSKWVGEGAERVREMFIKARRYAPAIIFIDEIDSIAQHRSDQESGAHREILNQILASMDGFNQADAPVFVLAATNHPDSLDAALRRPGRFDETIPIDLPNARARQEFFAIRLKKLGMDGADLSALVSGTSGMTPAQMDRIVREAAYSAAAAGCNKVTMDDLQAARRMVRFGARDEELSVDADELRGTAIHECGHALAHLILRPGRRIDYLTILPTEGGVLGFLAPEAVESRNVATRAEIEADVMVSLAGREAEALILGEENVSNGASSDLMHATAHLARAIGNWGMDNEWGLLSLSGLPQGNQPPSLATAVKSWLEVLRNRTRETLAQNTTLLTGLSDLLQKNESLEWAEIEAFLAESRDH